MKKPKAKKQVFEREIGGDGCEFTIVCHPAETATPASEDVRTEPEPDLVCRIIETKTRPAD